MLNKPLPPTRLLSERYIIGNPKASPPIPYIIPIGKTKFWALVKAGEFPAPVKIGRSTFWREDEVYAYVSSLSGSV